MSWGTKEEMAVLRYREEQQERKIRQLQKQIKTKKEGGWSKLWYAVPIVIIIFLYSETEIGIQSLQITKTGLIILGIIYLLTLGVIYAKRR